MRKSFINMPAYYGLVALKGVQANLVYILLYVIMRHVEAMSWEAWILFGFCWLAEFAVWLGLNVLDVDGNGE